MLLPHTPRRLALPPVLPPQPIAQTVRQSAPEHPLCRGDAALVDGKGHPGHASGRHSGRHLASDWPLRCKPRRTRCYPSRGADASASAETTQIGDSTEGVADTCSPTSRRSAPDASRPPRSGRNVSSLGGWAHGDSAFQACGWVGGVANGHGQDACRGSFLGGVGGDVGGGGGGARGGGRGGGPPGGGV